MDMTVLPYAILGSTMILPGILILIIMRWAAGRRMRMRRR
jgi:hypothetical protein